MAMGTSPPNIPTYGVLSGHNFKVDSNMETEGACAGHAFRTSLSLYAQRRHFP